VQNQIFSQFSPSAGLELTESDCELLRSFQIQPPALSKGRFPDALLGAKIADRLSTPMAWAGLVAISSGAIAFWWWTIFLVQRMNF
jgi:hypothetical protein